MRNSATLYRCWGTSYDIGGGVGGDRKNTERLLLTVLFYFVTSANALDIYLSF